MAAAWFVALSPAWANSSEPLVSTMREADRAVITLRAGDLTVTQTITRTAVDVRFVQGRDAIRFSGDLDGRVVVERGDQRRAFALRTASPEDQIAINAIAAESAAFAAFDALMQSDWARTAEMAALFTPTREWIRALQGANATVAEMAAAASMPQASIVPARQRLSPSQCWDTYSRDVVKFTYDLQSCLASLSANWWNPLHTAWCAYEYNLKSSLASIWLLDCYGVPI
jgi:hypothetical protein